MRNQFEEKILVNEDNVFKNEWSRERPSSSSLWRRTFVESDIIFVELDDQEIFQKKK